MRLTLEEVTLNNSNRKEFSHFSDLLNQERKELIEYKTLEAELGTDFITLFKAIKQGYIYRKIYLKDEDIDTDKFEIIKEDFNLLNFEEGHKTDGVLHCSCLAKTEKIDNYKQCYKYLNYISSYGESWALTIEELL